MKIPAHLSTAFGLELMMHMAKSTSKDRNIVMQMEL